MSTIARPVGKVPASTKAYYGGANEVSDVLLVSSLLNLHWGHTKVYRDVVECPVPSVNMNTELEEAIRAFQKSVVKIPPDGWVSPVGKTFKHLKKQVGHAVATGVVGTPTLQGQQIVGKARKIVGDRPIGGRATSRAGAHWLSGATGARLGTPGLDHRAIPVKSFLNSKISDPSINGCKNAFDTCWGRPHVVSHRILKKSDVMRYLKFMKGSGLPVEKWIGINVFLDENIETKASALVGRTVQSFLEEWFRKSTTPHLYPVKSDSAYRLRESCHGRLHFDCIGLVSWCYSTVLKKKWRFTPKQITRDLGFAKLPLKKTAKEELDLLAKKQPRLKEPLNDGDILYKLDPDTNGFHMGIYTSKGTVIHGPSYRRGIVEDSFDPAKNKQEFLFAARLRKLK